MSQAVRAVAVGLIGLVLATPCVAAKRKAKAAADGEAVRVEYSEGGVESAKLSVGKKLFADRDFVIAMVPDEVKDLPFTFRPRGSKADVTLDVPAGTTVYLIHSKGAKANRELLAEGWVYAGDVRFTEPGGLGTMNVLKIKFDEAGHLSRKASELSECLVAAKTLEIEKAAPPSAGPEPAVAGPATRPSAEQATIHALEIFRTESGMMLGQTSEVTLTVTRGDKPAAVGLSFAHKAGKQMDLARDEAIRFVRLRYPNWLASKAELTFEDKYTDHDGGSIGTALGVLTLATIEGFSIDPDLAITGDISANGKVRGIGGVAAKIKGAIAGKCKVTVLPVDNYEQLVDAVVYNGPSLVTDTQVVGVGTLTDAVAASRTDRPEKLAAAVDQFAKLQQAAAGKPAYFKTKPGKAALAAVEALAPQHYSAKLLSLYAAGTLPRTLSATASMYYATLAAEPVLDVLKDRSGKATKSPPSAAVKAGLADLRKLRPMANEGIRPLVDAYVRFIEAVDAKQSRNGSQQAIERQRKALLDELTRLRSDTDMMQKMLKEGI